MNHGKLIKFGLRLGYKLNDKGVCHGATLKWLEAYLLGEKHRELLLRRWKKIVEAVGDSPLLDKAEAIILRAGLQDRNSTLDEDKIKQVETWLKDHTAQNDLIAKIEAVKVKVKSHIDLTEEEYELLEIPAYYEAIAISQSPYEYSHIFNEFLRQNDIAPLSSYAGSSETEKQSGLKSIYNENGIYTKEEFESYLTHLQNFFDKTSQNTALLLTSINHDIGVYYDSKTRQWHVMDINQDTIIISDLKEEVVEALWKGFNKTNPPYTAISTEIITLGSQEYIDAFKLTHFKEDNLRKINPDIAIRKGEESSHLLFLAIKKGDLKTVKSIIKTFVDNGDKTRLRNTLAEKIRGITLLEAAIVGGYTEIVRILLENEADANQRTADLTPMILACEMGHFDIARLLSIASPSTLIEPTKAKNILRFISRYSKEDQETIIKLLKIDKEKPETLISLHTNELAILRKEKPLALFTHQQKLNQQLLKLEQEIRKLGSEYALEKAVIRRVLEKLEPVAKKFFENPEPINSNDLQIFTAECQTTIKEAKKELRQYLPIWHKIHPIFRSVLGILSALLIIPGLAVATTEKGFHRTFFKSYHSLDNDLEAIDTEIKSFDYPKKSS